MEDGFVGEGLGRWRWDESEQAKTKGVGGVG